MVCFCDIPLSQIKKHTDTYGCYGLGMSKKWTERFGLNPVLYLRRLSELTFSLSAIMKNLRKVESNDPNISIAANSFIHFLKYIKPYEGPFIRNGELLKKNVKFYDEREWRYVPNPEKYGGRHHLSFKEFQNESKRVQANEKLKKAKLTFEPSDIKYVILREEKEILGMSKALKEIKGSK